MARPFGIALTAPTDGRWRVAAPFVLTGGAAIIAGGLVAAIVAHRPVQSLVWMAAYLVLIVGTAQMVFGAGQAGLPRRVASASLVGVEWLVLNLGNAGVIAGTLLGSFALVLVGTVLFVVAIALFLFGTRDSHGSRWLIGYRVLLGVIFASSLVGLVLSAWSHLR